MEARSKKQFDEITNSGLHLVIFTAPWCGHCVHFKPTAEKVLQDNIGKFDIVYVNIDDNEEIAEEYNIMSIPTLMLFNDGKFVKKNVGGLSAANLQNFIGI